MDSKLSYSSLEGEIRLLVRWELVPVYAELFMTVTAKRPQVLLNKGMNLQTHRLPAEPKSRGLWRKEILTNNNLERKKEQFNGQNVLCQGMTLLSPTERSAIVPGGAGPSLMALEWDTPTMVTLMAPKNISALAIPTSSTHAYSKHHWVRFSILGFSYIVPEEYAHNH